MKRLFVCCDGTWNAPTDLQDGVPVPTNVCKFYNALADSDDVNAPSIQQLKYYHPGVGTNESWMRRVWDGAVGNGLARNVQSAYKWLADNYLPGDQIFVLGFSRGAFTARSVVGFMNRCGLPPTPDWPLVSEAFSLYRLDAKAASTLAALKRFREQHPSPAELEVHFVGVWDTVGALGIPKTLNPLGIDWHNNRFHDTTLCVIVRNAYHALAVDEMRSSFAPTLWTRAMAENQHVEQVWFAGVHADVGGGYKESSLSDITMKWMIHKASDCGAVFRDDMLAQLTPDAHGVLHDSDTGVFKIAPRTPRSVPNLADTGNVSCTGQMVDSSVLKRRISPPITQAPYRISRALHPGDSIKVQIFARDHWNWTGIYLEQGAAYEFLASGQWQDGHRLSGPSGDNGSFWMLPLDWFKRVRGANWFCLIGCIGDAANPSVEGNPGAMTTFEIGASSSFRCEVSGYLHCYANDANQLYFNNRGSVTLSVTRTA